MAVLSIKKIIPVIFIITFFCVKLATTSPLLESDDRFMLLTTEVNGLKSEMSQLANRLAEEKILREKLQVRNFELEKKIYELASENLKQNGRFDTLRAEFEAKIDQLIAKSSQQMEANLKHDENNNLDDTRLDESESNSLPKLPPSSCRQLSTIGHYLDGIYLVANPDSNKIEAVYCDFESSTLSETLYGNVDVKTKSVHFFVQRTSDFAPEIDAVLPFETQLLNEGGAMDLGSGIFTVPVNGIYHFEFKGMKTNEPLELRVFLQVNGVNIGTAYATNLPNILALSGIGASLRLKTGDQVRLYKMGATIRDSGNHYTSFIGWLVEEDSLFSA